MITIPFIHRWRLCIGDISYNGLMRKITVFFISFSAAASLFTGVSFAQQIPGTSSSGSGALNPASAALMQSSINLILTEMANMLLSIESQINAFNGTLSASDAAAFTVQITQIASQFAALQTSIKQNIAILTAPNTGVSGGSTGSLGSGTTGGTTASGGGTPTCSNGSTWGAVWGCEQQAILQACSKMFAPLESACVNSTTSRAGGGFDCSSFYPNPSLAYNCGAQASSKIGFCQGYYNPPAGCLQVMTKVQLETALGLPPIP